MQPLPGKNGAADPTSPPHHTLVGKWLRRPTPDLIYSTLFRKPSFAGACFLALASDLVHVLP